MKKTFSILFVCTGNTCRSPLAEAIMKAEVQSRGLKGVRISSAGTAAQGGLPSSANARLAARRVGASLAGFKSKPLTPARVSRADLVLTMDQTQKEEIACRWPEAVSKTFTISEFTGSGRGAIRDPVGRSEQVYYRCAEILKEEIEAILPEISRRAASRQRSRSLRRGLSAGLGQRP